MKIILPLVKAEVPIHLPVIFLAGPIQGGGNWQQTACEMVLESGADVALAVPRRWLVDDPDNHLLQHQLKGEPGFFERQTLWERYYLAKAAGFGCIMFWLPEESRVEPARAGKPYACNTLGELGSWRALKATGRAVGLVIGAEEGFPSLDVIRCNLKADLGARFPVHASLRETVWAALDYAASCIHSTGSP